MTMLAALARVESAKKAISAAKNDKEREKAIAELSAAIEATQKYKKKTVTTEEEEDDGQEAEEEESEEEEESTDGGDKSTTGSTQDSTSAEEDGKKMLAAKTGMYTYSRLFRLCHQAARAHTGKKSLSVTEVFDAINELQKSAKTHAKLAAKIERIEGERRAEKAEALISTAKRDGVITPAEAKDLARCDLGQVQSYLGIASKRPRMATTFDDPARPGTEESYARESARNGAPRSIVEGEDDAAPVVGTALRNGHGAKKPVQLSDFNRLNGKG